MPSPRRAVPSRRLQAARLLLACVLALASSTIGAHWGCYGTKPGHPTKDEREAFIREVGELAVKAEQKHGVPASVLAAIAIAESGYGWTRVAVHTNNLFAWKYLSRGAAEGRAHYVAACERLRGHSGRYIVFSNRADAVDYVAGKLATLDGYREHTDSYKAARKRGEAADRAAKAWLAGIAVRYSRKPAEFTQKIIRIMNHASEPSDAVAADHNLYRLSAGLKR